MADKASDIGTYDAREERGNSRSEEDRKEDEVEEGRASEKARPKTGCKRTVESGEKRNDKNNRAIQVSLNWLPKSQETQPSFSPTQHQESTRSKTSNPPSTHTD
jgi:hypothetical protein